MKKSKLILAPQLPGLTLESLVLYVHGLSAEDQPDADKYRTQMEEQGEVRKRSYLNKEKFTLVMAKYEPYRRQAEATLKLFSRNSVSLWDQFLVHGFDFIPLRTKNEALTLVRDLVGPSKFGID